MYCEDCKRKIPDELLNRESFECPYCGTVYERVPSRPSSRFDDSGRYSDAPYDDDRYEDNDHYQDYPEAYADEEPEPSRDDWGEEPRWKSFLRERAKLIIIAAAALIVILVVILLLTRNRGPKGPSASEYAQLFISAGLPLEQVTEYTEANDPNALLGRENQYTSKVDFADSRLEQSGEDLNGGTIEVFSTKEDLQARKEYVESNASGESILTEYVYESTNGLALICVSSDLAPEQAAQYEEVLQGKTIELIANTPTPTPEPTPEPIDPATLGTEVSSNQSIRAGQYIVGTQLPVGTFNFLINQANGECTLAIYENETTQTPTQTYSISPSEVPTVLENVVFAQGNVVMVTGATVVCNIYSIE